MKRLLYLLIPLVLIPLGVLLSLCVGEVPLTPRELISTLKEREGMEYVILTYIRLPRTLLSLAVGGSLSVVGAVLQGIFRNPLVEPYTLGISGGALLGVALTSLLGWGSGMFFSLPLAGFLGALLSIAWVYFMSLQKGERGMLRMLLSGVMISFISSSAVMFIIALSNREEMQNILFWTMGALQSTDMEIVYGVCGVSVLFLLLLYLFVKPLNALRFGERYASHWGIDTSKVIRLLFLLTSLLTGMCISVSGAIGFVGLLVPQFTRWGVGSDYRFLLIGSFLNGGLFLLVCDILSRMLIAPNELPVGVITGMVGGVVFLFLLSKEKKME